MVNFILHFRLNKLNTHINAKRENTLIINSRNDYIECEVYCDYKDEPLILSGKITGCDASLTFYEHRIELRCDGKLLDEEWPAGNILFTPNDVLQTDLPAYIEFFTESDAEEVPVITDVFTNAEGWRPDENVFVGDCMPYTDNERYHVLYLKDRHHHKSKWGLGAHQWEHISTDDFVNWSIHPMAVPITDKNEASICTGSHIKKDAVHHLYYTVRTCDSSPAPICRSLSHNGYHFYKDQNFSFALSDKYDSVTARDPKVIWGKDGLYHMLLTTRLMAEDKGCLAHLVSKDLETWTEKEVPEHICDDNIEPECPDYIEYNDFYYLIYSLNGKAYYKYSREPFGNWITPKNPEVPCSSVPKGAVWQGKIVFTGFKRIDGYAGTMTFKSATNSKSGELIFEQI